MLVQELANEKQALEAIELLNQEEYVVLDIETTGLSPFTDTITYIILGDPRGNIQYVLPGSYVTSLSKLKRPIVAHNFKFDFNLIYRAGVDLRVPGLLHDTMLLDHLLDENQEHSLDSIVKRRYNDDYKEKFWSKYKKFEEAPEEDGLNYACKDVHYTARAFTDIKQELYRAGIPDGLLSHVRDLALALYDTELKGLKLDLPYLTQMGEDLSGKITQAKADMRALVDFECEMIENKEYLKILDGYKTEKGKLNAKRPKFNFDSNTQLANLLYDRLGLPKQLNKKRKPTCDDAALEKLEKHHPVIAKLREYRGHQKVYTAFIEGSLEKMHAGRIYPSFNINGTVTGRISSSGPNMQQLPSTGGVRGIYIPDPGYRFISCDYAQLEVTLAAHFSKDRNLLKIVHEGASQHDITAAGLGIPRSLAKTINFALQYGAGVGKIQKILGCSEKDAQTALDKYWDTYAGLRDFVKFCHQKLDRGEPLVNPFGRRRHFPKEYRTFWDKERAKRQAPNALIQGTGADITNRAFYLVNKSLLEMGIGKALFPIHDEILIEVIDTSCNTASELLQSIMVGVGQEINLSVPLKVEASKPMERWAK